MAVPEAAAGQCRNGLVRSEVTAPSIEARPMLLSELRHFSFGSCRSSGDRHTATFTKMGVGTTLGVRLGSRRPNGTPTEALDRAVGAENESHRAGECHDRCWHMPARQHSKRHITIEHLFERMVFFENGVIAQLPKPSQCDELWHFETDSHSSKQWQAGTALADSRNISGRQGQHWQAAGTSVPGRDSTGSRQG